MKKGLEKCYHYFMKKKISGLLLLLFIYLTAFFVGFLVFTLVSKVIDHIIINLLIADVAATIYVFIASIVFRTASVYDPYWSVQTIIIYLLLQFKYGFNLGNSLVLAFLAFWAIRLTVNFIKTFNDISYVDWRYKMLEQKSKKLYPLISLFGIHLFPTLIVFAASIPLFSYVIYQIEFSYLNLIGLAIMLLGTLLELISDIDMHKFKANRKDRSEIINVGLWKYSRHPNYLGEILFWFGAALTLIIPHFEYWYLATGAILNYLMFLFISIPMAENNMKKYKPGFDEYKKRVRMLLPFKKRSH